MDILDEVAAKAGITLSESIQASEVLLEALHKRLVEYQGGNGDYLGELAHSELTERAYYHLLGFVEQLSRKYAWEKGDISEYLGRLPPVERWKAFSKETMDWKWSN